MGKAGFEPAVENIAVTGLIDGANVIPHGCCLAQTTAFYLLDVPPLETHDTTLPLGDFPKFARLFRAATLS